MVSAPVFPPFSFEESPNFPRKLSLRDGKSYFCITRLGRKIVFPRFWPESVKKAGSGFLLKMTDRAPKKLRSGDFFDGRKLSEQKNPLTKAIWKLTNEPRRSGLLRTSMDPAFFTDSSQNRERLSSKLTGGKTGAKAQKGSGGKEKTKKRKVGEKRENKGLTPFF